MQDLKEIIENYLSENKKNILWEDIPLDVSASTRKNKRKSGKNKSGQKYFNAHNYSTNQLILNYRHTSKMLLHDKKPGD